MTIFRGFAWLVGFGSLLSAQIQLGPVTEKEIGGRLVGQLLKTGVHRTVAANATKQGSWETDGEGRRVYRLRVSSAEALGIRLHFEGFDVGEGQVSLSQPGGRGAEYARYSGKGPFGDGDFWSHTIDGAELVLEYRPAYSDAALAPNFTVSSVSHRFSDSLAKIGETVGDPGQCHLDVTCHPEWLDSGRSVAKLVFETEEGQFFCTGALVRTKSGSGIPYFLTADHCLSDDATARTVETIWNFQTTTCNSGVADARIERPAITGARYVVSSKGTQTGDYSLVILNSIPAGARFANYDPTDPAAGAPLVGIHHPLGTYKRISFGSLFVDYWALDGNQFPAAFFHQVRWTGGAVHHGSSGSPLFSATNTITGMLSYGVEFNTVAICDQQPRVNGYAKLSEAWPKFSPYLEDAAATQLTASPMSSTYALVNPPAGVNSEARTLVISSTNVDPIVVSIVPSDPWIVVSQTQGTVRNGAPLSVRFWVRPSLINRTGLYTGTINLVSGKVTQSVAVTANVTLIPSAVTLKATPNPVVPKAEDAQGCRYFFNLSAEETAGIDTRLTRLSINGEDYTAQLVPWFGGDVLGRNGRLVAQVRLCSPGVPASQVFTLVGTDTVTGRTWTQSATVEFLP